MSYDVCMYQEPSRSAVLQLLLLLLPAVLLHASSAESASKLTRAGPAALTLALPIFDDNVMKAAVQIHVTERIQANPGTPGKSNITSRRITNPAPNPLPPPTHTLPFARIIIIMLQP
jgi:hypothetical protein